MKKPIFKSTELQKNFDDDGFAVFPLLGKEEIDCCVNLYHSISEELPFKNGIHITFEQSEPEQHRYLSAKICDLLREPLNNIFDRFNFFNGSFVVKGANNTQSSVELHHDWSFVREDFGFRGGTLWVALTDTTIENGAIGVIRGSHKWVDMPRYTPHGVTPPIWFDHKDLLAEYVEIIEMPAGTGIVWDQELIHSSFPNFTDQPRLVISTVITEEEAKPCFFVIESGNNPQNVEIIELNKEFFDEQTIKTMLNNFQTTGKIAEIPSSETLPIVIKPNLEKQEILELLSQSGLNEPNRITVNYLESLKNKEADSIKSTSSGNWLKKLLRIN